MTSILPSPEEYAALTPAPGSPVHRAFNDARLLSTAGYATLLQVAYPTVGHGVHQYSSFTKDPWGRLLRTLDYVHGTISGGPELAGEIGARVRNLHKTINGPLPGGGRYNAMEPEAFAWVHATLAVSIIEGNRHFARPYTTTEKQAFWTQWRDVGRLVGVRYRDLPESVVEFEAYVERMKAEKLVWTPAIAQVMGTPNAEATRPRGVPPLVWTLISAPLSRQFHLITTGLLGPELRDRFRLAHTRTDEALFRALSATSRISGPLIRGPLAEVGTYYVRWRSEALARGDVAGAAQAPRPRAAA